MMFACCLPLQVTVMIVASVCLIIRFRTFVSRSLRHSLPLRGYAFARSDRRQIDRALDWADVGHLEEPFMLQAIVARRARARGVPALATYHIHPENLTASVYLDRCTVLNRAILQVWKRFVFDRCGALQCPSPSVWRRASSLRLSARPFCSLEWCSA